MTTSTATTPSVPYRWGLRVVLLSALASPVVGGMLANSSTPLPVAAPAIPAAFPPAPKVPAAAAEEKLVADHEEITGHVDAIETVESRARVSAPADAVQFQSGQRVQTSSVFFVVDWRRYRTPFDLTQAHAYGFGSGKTRGDADSPRPGRSAERHRRSRRLSRFR